jgi:1,4-alpha-glucan branching enzyme
MSGEWPKRSSPSLGRSPFHAPARDPGATPLRRTGAAGLWSVVVPLPPGAYLYAFVVDGDTWVADAAAPRAPESAFGGPTSIVVVGEEL